MSAKDIWGDMEIEMLRAGIKQLEADKERLLQQNRTMSTCFNLMKGVLGKPFAGSHVALFTELERLIEVGLNERSK